MTTTVRDLDLFPIETDVYRIHDLEGTLLYVGMSLDWARRIGQHRAKPWWREVSFIEITKYPTPEDARIAESRAIADEEPLYNVHGTSRDPNLRPRMRKPQQRAIPSIAPSTPRATSMHERILTAMKRMAADDPTATSFLTGQISRRVIDAIPRSKRTGNIRALISETLSQMAADESDDLIRVVAVDRGTNPVNKLSLLAYRLEYR